MDLHESLPRRWTVIGGQMVHLHCAELTVPVSRQARTKSAAQANLLDHIRILSVDPGLMTPNTTIPQLAEF